MKKHVKRPILIRLESKIIFFKGRFMKWQIVRTGLDIDYFSSTMANHPVPLEGQLEIDMIEMNWKSHLIDEKLRQQEFLRSTYNKTHHTGVSSERPEIYHCWSWYGSDLQTLEDQAHWVLKKFHDLDPR